jgi:hypothetical protein
MRISNRWAWPFFFGPDTLVRTWGTHPDPLDVRRIFCLLCSRLETLSQDEPPSHISQTREIPALPVLSTLGALVL